jgi:LuxR family maltose regulon positive regulatory protein
LRLAQPARYRRVFLDEGRPMAKLLRRMKAEGRRPKVPEGIKSYVDALLASFAQRPVDKSLHPSSFLLPPSVESLSPQERRVLRLLTAGLSNSEIARELVVSTNTIKTQLQSIYRKLDVTNREQAADAAQKLELL